MSLPLSLLPADLSSLEARKSGHPGLSSPRTQHYSPTRPRRGVQVSSTPWQRRRSPGLWGPPPSGGRIPGPFAQTKVGAPLSGPQKVRAQGHPSPSRACVCWSETRGLPGCGRGRRSGGARPHLNTRLTGPKIGDPAAPAARGDSKAGAAPRPGPWGPAVRPAKPQR